MISFLLSLFIATTSLSVKVTDAQNAAVPGARVAVYTHTGFSSMQRTDDEGSAQIDVPGGMYLIEVDADGFRKTSKSVIVRQGESAHEQFSLSVEGVNSSVTVTASDVPQTPDQTTKALTVISSSEIVDRDEYTLAGIMSTVPGTQVRSVGGPGQTSTLRVRGLRPDATSVLIDGMRFRDAATTQGDASSFTSNLSFISVDRVEVLRGSGSSLYGTNAAGGAVNVVTDEGGGVTHGMLQSEGGALGFLRGRMQVGGGALRDRLNYAVGFVHMNVLRGIDGDDRARGSGAQLFLRYKLLPATSLSLRYFGSDDFTQVNTSPTATGIPATNIPSTIIVAAVPLTTYIPGRDDPDSRRASRFHTTALKFQHLFSPAVGLQASYQKVSTRRTFDNGPSGFGFQPAAINYTKLQGGIDTVDVRSNLSLSRWNQLTTGYEFERETYADVQDNNLPAAQRIRTETSIRQNTHAIYFQDQSSVLGRVQISISGRAQVFRPQRPRFSAAGVTNPYQSVGLTTPPKALTADVSVSYFASASRTKFRVHAGNAYRAPALYERFGGGFSTIQATGQLVFSPWGDPTLRPDRYNSVDGGIDQYLWHDRVRLSSSYFYTRVASITAFDSGTVLRAATDPYGRSSGYINGSGGLSRGVEWSAESRPAAGLTLSGSYTYTRAHMDRDITVPGFWRVLGIPRHSITLFATRSFGPRLDVATDLAAISEMYGNFTAAGRPRAYRYPGFTKVDVSARYSLRRTDHGGLRLTTRMENVLNKAYYDLGWLAARATFVGGLSYQF